MYTTKHIKDLNNNFIEILGFQKESYAKIHLNSGGSLQELVLKNHHVIKDLHPLTYQNTYASSILFPFANRIADVIYEFGGNQYSLDINQEEENNALHGLVYNKKFELIGQKTTEDEAEVTLQYQEQNYSKGFHYTYTIILKYILTNNGLDLNVTINNTDTKPFPFTLGWHPYFYSSDLHNSTLNFDSTKKLVFDERNITKEVINIPDEDVFEVKDKSLDDCYILNKNQTQFNTPDYKLLISASSKENFLQIYTPPKANTIAIEPTTGVSNSFNNKIGLQTLKPNESYSLNWNVKLI